MIDRTMRLYEPKDAFKLIFKEINNVGSMIPGKKLPKGLTLPGVVVKIDESYEFLDIEAFSEMEKILVDFTPMGSDAEHSVTVALKFPKLTAEELDYIEEGLDEEEEGVVFEIKLHGAAPKEPAEDFLSKITKEQRFFFVLFSAPTFEGRALVSYKTGTISAKAFVERSAPIQ